MPALSLREAALRFQVSRATLAKDLSKGKLSGARDEAGNWRIDAAELARVYEARAGAVRPSPPALGQSEPALATTSGSGINPPASSDESLALRLTRAEAELAAERGKVALLERHLEDLRRMLPAPEVHSRRRWWPW